MEYEYNTNEQTREAYSLLELNNRVKHVLQQAIPDTCWIRAEMSDVRCNASSGH